MQLHMHVQRQAAVGRRQAARRADRVAARPSRVAATQVKAMADEDLLHALGLDEEEAHPVPLRGQGVRLFLDTASEDALLKWLKTGIFYGVTTNPTILKRDGVKCSKAALIKLTSLAFEHGCEEMHMQAWGGSSGALSKCALDLAGIDPQRVVVKLPCTEEGMQAASMLCNNKARVNLTGLFAPHQVLIAQALGAEYAAPYLGRMNDTYGGDKVGEMLGMLKATGSPLRLMVASIRDVTDMAKLAAQGCNTFTISPETAEKLFDVPATLEAVKQFEADAASNLG